jgi:acyl-coenzyme A synthetase/AMP-(fatty) acid ligase
LTVAETLQAYARAEMAAYKCARMEFLPELPKDPVGKIQRRSLVTSDPARGDEPDRAFVI